MTMMNYTTLMDITKRKIARLVSGYLHQGSARARARGDLQHMNGKALAGFLHIAFETLRLLLHGRS
jgi:hypothetical protein